ncbi:MAG: hypothetical protein J5994_11405 [Ruminococcus sp.]|nr:hypothetical protein [Ruminococcus sp.]
MTKYKFTDICKEIVTDYEIKHSDYQRVIYKKDVFIKEYRYTDTEFYAECCIDKRKIFRITYNVKYDRIGVEIFSLQDSMVYYRKR